MSLSRDLRPMGRFLWSDCTSVEFRYLYHTDVAARGIRHGFCGIDLDFSPSRRIGSAQRFLEALQIESLILVQQVHGTALFDVRGIPTAQGLTIGPEADSVCIERGRVGTAIAVLSADCLPLIIVGESQLAVVHAGWRGLAGGVIEAALQSFEPSSELTILLGPCAGPSRYEVGEEVLRQFAGRALYKSVGPGKFLLDLAGTARVRIKESGLGSAFIESCDNCTISDQRFHSHRRLAQHSGRNVSFVIG